MRISPRKARLVAEHIRGRSVPEARAVLAFTSREAARAIEKVLHSAVSNAESNHGLSEDGLYIKEAYVNAGPMLKRWRPRARGRVARIHKRTCHITVLLASVAPEEAPSQNRTRANRKKTTSAPPPETTTAPPPETSTANTEEAAN